MVGIKINENVYLSKVQKSTTGEAIELTWKSADEKIRNLFEESQETEIKDAESNEATVRVWSLKVPTFKNKDNTEQTLEQKLTYINDKMKDTKYTLAHILARYLTTDQIKFDQYAGLEVNNSNYETEWMQPAVLKAMFNNIANQFIELIGPFVGDKTLTSRLKLVRQSADKPFPTFPGVKYLNANPFYESMDVPADSTKIKFSDYEIKQGLANNEVPDKTGADPVQEASPEVVNSVFGSR
jgi:hypothetical protein